jgi:hypothetical protein
MGRRWQRERNHVVALHRIFSGFLDDMVTLTAVIVTLLPTSLTLTVVVLFTSGSACNTSTPPYAFLILAPTLAHLIEQCESLQALALEQSLPLGEDHFRVVDDITNPILRGKCYAWTAHLRCL